MDIRRIIRFVVNGVGLVVAIAGLPEVAGFLTAETAAVLASIVAIANVILSKLRPLV